MKLVVCGMCIALASALVACGGANNGSVAATPASPAYSATIEAAEPNAAASPANLIVLYDAQFIDPFHSAAVAIVSIQPQPPESPVVNWTASNSSIVVQQQEPNYASPAPTAPPLATFVGIGSTYGAATVTARIGAPVNRGISIPVYHYPSLSFGCRFRYAPAFDFDPAANANGTDSDLYDTIGSDRLGPLDPCQYTPFAMTAGTPEVWHTPYGGVLVTGVSLSQFPSVQTSQWQNAATHFSPQSGILLFKTKGGRIVKAMVPIGPFEVSDDNGQFPY
jgi:hypothetical protein